MNKRSSSTNGNYKSGMTRTNKIICFLIIHVKINSLIPVKNKAKKRRPKAAFFLKSDILIDLIRIYTLQIHEGFLEAENCLQSIGYLKYQ
jgi:hypothetical protein